ncbi:MAG: hypothetical protein ABEI76_05885 [Halobacteriales archaeon]
MDELTSESKLGESDVQDTADEINEGGRKHVAVEASTEMVGVSRATL